MTRAIIKIIEYVQEHGLHSIVEILIVFGTFSLIMMSIAYVVIKITTRNDNKRTDKRTDIRTHKIKRADLNGGNVEDLITELSSPGGIALDLTDRRMYWTARGIKRADLDGGNVEDILTRLDGLRAPWGFALDLADRKMYWTGS
jgi:hypothetical protein